MNSSRPPARPAWVPPAILRRHIIPNLVGPVVVYATLTIPQMILFESFLSFLGLGVQEPLASLGSLINDGAQEMQSAPWMLLVPAAFLIVTAHVFQPRWGMLCAMRSIHVTAERQQVGDFDAKPGKSRRHVFASSRGDVHAVRNLSLTVAPGECLGVVGESGAGKSQAFLAALGLLAANGRALWPGALRFRRISSAWASGSSTASGVRESAWCSRIR